MGREMERQQSNVPATLAFAGTILPKDGSSFNIMIKDKEFALTEYGVENTKFHLSVINSDFTIEWYCPPTYKVSHRDIYLGRSSDIIHATTSIVSFATGIHYFPHFHTMREPNGSVVTPLIFGDLRLVGLCKSFNVRDMREAFDIIFSKEQLMRAMRDLIGAMDNPNVVAINCTRVIETIKDVMTSSLKLNEDKKWYTMRHNLNIDRKYLQYITDSSRKHRHGKAQVLLGDEVRDIYRRTWIIMDRFILYSMSGSLKLDENDYPILSI
jgi:hypothetical protein